MKNYSICWKNKTGAGIFSTTATDENEAIKSLYNIMGDVEIISKITEEEYGGQ